MAATSTTSPKPEAFNFQADRNLIPSLIGKMRGYDSHWHAALGSCRTEWLSANDSAPLQSCERGLRSGALSALQLGTADAVDEANLLGVCSALFLCSSIMSHSLFQPLVSCSCVLCGDVVVKINRNRVPGIDVA